MDYTLLLGLLVLLIGVEFIEGCIDELKPFKDTVGFIRLLPKSIE